MQKPENSVELGPKTETAHNSCILSTFLKYRTEMQRVYLYKCEYIGL